jgi:hypothetical protein
LEQLKKKEPRAEGGDKELWKEAMEHLKDIKEDTCAEVKRDR